MDAMVFGRDALTGQQRREVAGQGLGRTLAWARTGDDGLVVAGVGALGVKGVDGWAVTRWHDIVHGGWDADSGVLTWHTPDGHAHTATLTRAGRVPEVFRERVNSAVVHEDRFTIAGVSVLISVHRDLGDANADLVWRATAVDGRSLEREGVREAVAERMAALRTELGV